MYEKLAKKLAQIGEVKIGVSENWGQIPISRQIRMSDGNHTMRAMVADSAV